MMITMVCAIFDDDDDGLIFYIPVASVEGNKYVVETILQFWPGNDDYDDEFNDYHYGYFNDDYYDDYYEDCYDECDDYEYWWLPWCLYNHDYGEHIGQLNLEWLILCWFGFWC